MFLCFRLPPPHLPPPTERAAFQSFPLHYRRRTWRLAGSLTLAASRATIISPPASNIHQSRYSPHFFVCRHINTNYFRVLTMPSASYRSGGDENGQLELPPPRSVPPGIRLCVSAYVSSRNGVVHQSSPAAVCPSPLSVVVRGMSDNFRSTPRTRNTPFISGIADIRSPTMFLLNRSDFCLLLSRLPGDGPSH